MGRIEISLDEYNALNNRIKELEDKNVELEKELESKNSSISSLKEIVTFFVDLTFFERLIHWRKILKSININLYTDEQSD